MDEMEALDYRGLQFLCSGEQLPSGLYQAVVRHKAPPDDQIRTLVLDPRKQGTAGLALQRAKDLARKWANERAGDGRSDG